MNIVNIDGNTAAEEAMFLIRVLGAVGYLVASRDIDPAAKTKLHQTLSSIIDGALAAVDVSLKHPSPDYTVMLSTRGSPQPNSALFVCALVHTDSGVTEVELQETVFYEE